MEASQRLSSSAYGLVGRGVLFVHLALVPVLCSRATVEGFESVKVAWLSLTALIVVTLGISWWLPILLNLVPKLRLGNAGDEAPASSRVSHKAAYFRARLEAGASRLAFRSRSLGTSFLDLLSCGVLLFALSAVVSTVASVCPHTSFYGAHTSYLGLFTLLSYVVLFFATKAFCRGIQDARRLLIAAVLATAIVGSYAALQVAGLDPITWTNESLVGTYVRPASTLGHPNVLAGYLVMTFPLVVFFIGMALGRRNWAMAAVLAIVAALAVGGIVAALSRGAWLAFAAVVVTLIVGAGALRRFGRVAGIVGAVLVVVSAVALWAAKDGEAVRALAERAGRVGDVGGRRFIWAAGWRIGCEHPLFGSGLDTFQLAFAGQRTPAYWQQDWGATPTRAHNEIIHLWATQGMLGIVALSLVAIGVGLAWRRAWRRYLPADRLLLIALGALVVGFIAQSMVGFTMAGCGTLVVTVAALLARLAEADEEERGSARNVNKMGRCLQGAVWAGAAALAFVTVVQPLRADRACRQGLSLQETNPDLAQTYLEAAVEQAPQREVYWTYLGDLLCRLAKTPAYERGFLLRARAAYTQARDLVPLNAYHHANLAAVLADLIPLGQATPAEAFDEYNAALTLDPENVYFHRDIATAALRLGDLPRARWHIARGLQSYPDYAPINAQAGHMALQDNRPRDAIRYLRVVHASRDVDCNPMAWLSASAALATTLHGLDRTDEALEVARAVVAREPAWPNGHFILGHFLQQRGQIAEARAEFQVVIDQHPTHFLADLARQRIAPLTDARAGAP